MLLTLPGGQDHTGHLRKAGVVLLLIGSRVQVPIPSPIQGILGELKEPLGSRPLLFIHPWAMPFSKNVIYLFVQYRNWREGAYCLLPTSHPVHTNVYSI